MSIRVIADLSMRRINVPVSRGTYSFNHGHEFTFYDFEWFAAQVEIVALRTWLAVVLVDRTEQ